MSNTPANNDVLDALLVQLGIERDAEQNAAEAGQDNQPPAVTPELLQAMQQLSSAPVLPAAFPSSAASHATAVQRSQPLFAPQSITHPDPCRSVVRRPAAGDSSPNKSPTLTSPANPNVGMPQHAASQASSHPSSQQQQPQTASAEALRRRLQLAQASLSAVDRQLEATKVLVHAVLRERQRKAAGESPG